MTTAILSKPCTKCKEVKLLSDFHKGDSHKDGLYYACKRCTLAHNAGYRAANADKIRDAALAYYKANIEKLKDAAAAYRAANPEKRKASVAKYYSANTGKQKIYRANNLERYKAYSVAWAKANPEKIKASSNLYRKSNLEKVNAATAIWAKNNPELRRISQQNRTAKKREVGGTLSRGLSAKLFKLQRGTCPPCGRPLGDNFHMDHVIPLALDGPNIDSNMQLLCKPCNLSKHAKHPIDFMQSRGFLL